MMMAFIKAVYEAGSSRSVGRSRQVQKVRQRLAIPLTVDIILVVEIKPWSQSDRLI